MIDLIELVTAMATTLSNIPELVTELAPVDPVIAYLDANPLRNSVTKARYQMQPGQVMVAWLETIFQQDEMSAWSHRIEIYVRAMRDHSDLELIQKIMNGVPIPGDGQIWRICPILTGCLPTNVLNINRVTDEEGIDYAVILTETAETGDWPRP